MNTLPLLLHNPVLQQFSILLLGLLVIDRVKPAKYSQMNDSIASMFWDISFICLIAAGLLVPAYLTTKLLTINQGDWLVIVILAIMGILSGKARHRLEMAALALVMITILTILVGQPLLSVTEIPFQIMTRFGMFL